MRARLVQAIIRQQRLGQAKPVFVILAIVGQGRTIVLGRYRRQIGLHRLVTAIEPALRQRRFGGAVPLDHILREGEAGKNQHQHNSQRHPRRTGAVIAPACRTTVGPRWNLFATSLTMCDNRRAGCDRRHDVRRTLYFNKMRKNALAKPPEETPHKRKGRSFS